VVKTGGFLYLAVADATSLLKSMSYLQSDRSGLRIVDSATSVADGRQTLIVEKADYVSKIVVTLRKATEENGANFEYPIDVVVPIYNAYEHLERCLYSLFKHQDMYRIILIDDCSTDKRVKELLQILQEHKGKRFEIVENEANVGFVKTANRGMQMVKGDVILLNSDTIVTSGWARKMMACAYANDRVGTVTPFTNVGGETSIPEFGQANEIPAGLTIDSFAELVEKCSFNRFPELVTAIGFCMYVRRAVIDEIGYFDEKNFGRGYGEENDFSMRAIRKGYKNVLCDNTFVFHKVGASFGHARDAHIVKSKPILEKLWPEFWPAIYLFWQLNPLKELQDNVKAELAKASNRM
jgi:GT2 family glycosyltransferase